MFQPGVAAKRSALVALFLLVPIQLLAHEDRQYVPEEWVFHAELIVKGKCASVGPGYVTLEGATALKGKLPGEASATICTLGHDNVLWPFPLFEVGEHLLLSCSFPRSQYGALDMGYKHLDHVDAAILNSTAIGATCRVSVLAGEESGKVKWLDHDWADAETAKRFVAAFLSNEVDKQELTLLRRVVATSVSASAPVDKFRELRAAMRAKLHEATTIAAAVEYLFDRMGNAPADEREVLEAAFLGLERCGRLTLAALDVLKQRPQPAPILLRRVHAQLSETVAPPPAVADGEVDIAELRKSTLGRPVTGQRDAPRFALLSRLDPASVFEELVGKDYSQGSDSLFGYEKTRWFLHACGDSADEYARKLQSSAKDEGVQLSAATFLNTRDDSGLAVTRRIARESKDSTCKAIAMLDLFRLGDLKQLDALIKTLKDGYNDRRGWLNERERAIVGRLILILRGLPEKEAGEKSPHKFTDATSPEAWIIPLASWWEESGRDLKAVAELRDIWFDQVRKRD